MTYSKLTALCIAVLISLVSYAQDITVTIEKQLPAAVHTLDFITVLDEASVKALQKEGLNVEVHSAILSSGASKYHCSCLLYTSPSPRDKRQSRMPSSA